MKYVLINHKGGPVKKRKSQNLDEDDIVSANFYGIMTIYEFALFNCLVLNSTTREAIAVFKTMNIIITNEFFWLSYEDVGATISK